MTDVVTSGTPSVIVFFDIDCTWDGVDLGTLTLDGDAMEWSGQPNSNQIAASSIGLNPHGAGEAWSLPGPEPGLSPSPAVPENGTTS